MEWFKKPTPLWVFVTVLVSIFVIWLVLEMSGFDFSGQIGWLTGDGIDGLDLIPSSPHFIEIQDEIPSIPQRRYGAGSYVTVLYEFLQSIIERQNYNFYPTHPPTHPTCNHYA